MDPLPDAAAKRFASWRNLRGAQETPTLGDGADIPEGGVGGVVHNLGGGGDGGIGARGERGGDVLSREAFEALLPCIFHADAVHDEVRVTPVLVFSRCCRCALCLSLFLCVSCFSRGCLSPAHVSFLRWTDARSLLLLVHTILVVLLPPLAPFREVASRLRRVLALVADNNCRCPTFCGPGREAACLILPISAGASWGFRGAVVVVVVVPAVL